jgi:hypothetical protein
MKSLFFGIVLILLLGIGGFLYRNVMETTGGPLQTACTLEAKICPDGSSVGRTGPSCEFTPCAFPNVEIPTSNLSFVLPEGYVADENAYGAEPTIVGVFVKPSLSNSVSHTIIVRQFKIAEGETFEDVLLAQTRFQPSDMQAENIEKFDQLLINGRTWYHVVIERFEAIVHSAYYLPREKDVILFEVIEHDVTEWMEADLNVRDLPEHGALEALLLTLQSI